MSITTKVYDAEADLSAPCSCGKPHAKDEHDAQSVARHERIAQGAMDAETLAHQTVESAMVRALFPDDRARRRFLGAVGVNTAMAAIASVLPIGAMQALAQDKRAPEKKNLKIGFIPITCATPLILAHPLRYYAAEGLEVEVIKTAGWALIRDKVLNKEYDASHLLAPMPIAISMGIGSSQQAINVATIQNINGQSITLANKHKDKRDPKMWKGFKFAVPFEFSMHNFLLRYYVAEFGLDPDKDIQIRVVPPPEMVANLRAGNIDGYLGPDPFNQRAVYEEVGFIHLLSKELWDGHPCCSFGAPTQFIKENPNSFAALFRAVLKGAALARDPANRKTIAESIAPANYLNQPVAVLEQVLTGKYADGLGNIKNDPSRVDFDPFPWYSMATWILSQMKRWGYIKGDVRWKELTEQVYLLTDARKHMASMGYKPPSENYRKITVMGKVFDHTAPDAYVASFAIKRA
jgi:nitrate/nitrite transport system substrate-binding protein